MTSFDGFASKQHRSIYWAKFVKHENITVLLVILNVNSRAKKRRVGQGYTVMQSRIKVVGNKEMVNFALNGLSHNLARIRTNGYRIDCLHNKALVYFRKAYGTAKVQRRIEYINIQDRASIACMRAACRAKREKMCFL